MDTNLTAEEIAKKAIKVASEICVFTNDKITIEKFNGKIKRYTTCSKRQK